MAIRVFKTGIGIHFHDPRAFAKFQRRGQHAGLANAERGLGIVLITDRAFEFHGAAGHGDRLSFMVRKPPGKDAVFIRRLRLPVERGLFLAGFSLLIEFLAGDIGVLHDQPAPATDGIVGHGQVDGDDDTEEGNHDAQHVPAGKRACGFRLDRHYLPSGAMKVAL